MKIANIISIFRILLTPILIFSVYNPLLFGILFLIAGISDTLDGTIARYFKQTSSLGSKLDTIGDSLLLIPTIIAFIIHFDLSFILPFLIATLVLIVIYRITQFIIYKKFLSYHFLTGKLSAVILYIFISYTFIFSLNKTFAYIALLSLIICQLEEFIATLLSTNPKKLSIF